MIEIDGSEGEGGGQVLRTSLALSIITRTPFRLVNIRAGREQPGLKKQHLACVHAAAQISAARVTGDTLGSSTLTFEPDGVWPGSYHVDIDGAGSTTLVLQTVLYPLLCADGESQVRISGGTHNAWAPPMDFLRASLMPLLARMGASVDSRILAHGFYPRGGGKIWARILPWEKRIPIDLNDRGNPKLRARVLHSRLPQHVADRELEVIREALKLPNEACCDYEVESIGPGNSVHIFAEGEHVTETVSSFGKRGIPAERVAMQAVKAMQAYLSADVPVGEHLADQLLLPMALGAGGRFRTVRPSQHTLTNIATIGRFIDTPISVAEDNGTWLVSVG